jgi:hypothetical protein
MAANSDKLNNLTKHLEKNRSALNSKTVPDRHINKEEAYREFLRREIRRTEKSIENLRLSTVKS